MNEKELSAQLIAAMSEDFDIQREVTGNNLLTGETIRADIVAHPKLHLIASGFVPGYFCVEVKAVPTSRPEKRGREVVWQALSYRLARFDFGVPVFAFVYPPLWMFYYDKGEDIEYFNPTTADIKKAQRQAKFQEVAALIQRGNVGWIEIQQPNSYKPDGDLRLLFGAGRYWSKVDGISPVKNIGVRLHVGTSK